MAGAVILELSKAERSFRDKDHTGWRFLCVPSQSLFLSKGSEDWRDRAVSIYSERGAHGLEPVMAAGTALPPGVKLLLLFPPSFPLYPVPLSP